MTDTTTSTHISQMSTVIVPVSDQDRALDFYVEKLGFEKRADIPLGEEMRWIEVAPPGAATTIAIVPPRPGEPIGVETRVAFKSEDIEADHANLLAHGVEIDPEISRMGAPVPPMVFFRDPDGNQSFLVELS